MSDSNEPAEGSGPDPQSQKSAQNDQPQAAPEPPAPPAQEPEPPTPPAEQNTAPPAVDPPEPPTPPAEQNTAPPAVDPPDTPPPAAEEDSSPPPAREQGAADRQEPPTDSQGDEAPRVEPAATQTADKPSGESKAPQAPRRGRSAKAGSARRRPGKPPKGPSVVIRYGIMGYLGQFRHNLQPPPARGRNVVVRTDRGVELGEVVAVVSEDEQIELGYVTPPQLEEHIINNGPDYQFRRDGKVLRLANPQDLIDQRHLTSSAKDERKFCVQEIKDLKLDMKLVAAEHLLGGERIIFYFLAEHRIDFRELVHTLANQYHTRIEMRQVGARDEARLVGDYERCGQECCCKQFLKGLQPVSMRMAKTQKATLDPSKISGRCGRLMCCLRYEDQCYRDLKKRLPHKNIWVKTSDQIGRVTGTQILTQLVQVQLPDGSRAVFPNEALVERNVDPPEAPPAAAPRTPGQSARKDARGRKQQNSNPPGRQAKPAANQQTTKPRDKTEPQPAPQPAPTPQPEPQPRASAEALDPGWAGLLGESVIEDVSQPPQDPQAPPTIPPAEESQASPEPQTTAEATPETPEPTQSQPQTPADRSGGDPAQTGNPRKKRRRGRGRRSKRKPGN